MTKISNIRVLPITSNNACVAIVSVTLFDVINLTGLKLYKCNTAKDKDKMFVCYPLNPGSKKHAHYVYPTNAEFNKELTAAIIDEYNKTIEQTNEKA